MLGGKGDAATLATSTMTFAAAATADDGKTFNLKIGDRELTFTFSDSATSTTIDGDNITVDFNDLDANTVTSAKVKTALDTIFANDSSLSDNYAITTGAGSVILTAKTVSMDANGKLTGPLDGGSVAWGDGSYTGATGVTTQQLDSLVLLKLQEILPEFPLMIQVLLSREHIECISLSLIQA